jgi:hypothetical protein
MDMNAPRLMLVALATSLALAISQAQDAPATPDKAPAEGAQPAEKPAEPAAKIKPQDQLLYEVKEDPIAPTAGFDVQKLRVGALGEVRFLVSRGYGDTIPVKVTGRTVEEVREELRVKLEADYYQKATVVLQLDSASAAEAQQGGQVHFYGEVKGVVRLKPGETKKLSEALIEIGWSEFSDLKRVKIHRPDPATGERKTIIFNVHEVLHPPKNKPAPKDFELQDQDRVQVEAKTFNLFGN